MREGSMGHEDFLANTESQIGVPPGLLAGVGLGEKKTNLEIPKPRGKAKSSSSSQFAGTESHVFKPGENILYDAHAHISADQLLRRPRVLSESQTNKFGDEGHILRGTSGPPDFYLDLEGLEKNFPKVEGRDFKILKELGEGGMGIVYTALEKKGKYDNPKEGKDEVVIKIIKKKAGTNNKDRMNRFQREIESQANVDPYAPTVKLLDVVETNQGPGIVMEYMKDGNLDDFLRKEADGSADEKLVADVGIQIATALHYLHERGWAHRDLKPENVFVGKSPNLYVKLGDFGLLKAVEETKLEKESKKEASRISSMDRRITSDMATVGTPAFMSPESLQDNKKNGKNNDLYALGIMMYQMLAGKEPFYSNTGSLAGYINFKCANDPPPINEIMENENPTVLQKIIMTMISRDARDREKLELEDGTKISLKTAEDIVKALDTHVVGYWEREEYKINMKKDSSEKNRSAH